MIKTNIWTIAGFFIRWTVIDEKCLDQQRLY